MIISDEKLKPNETNKPNAQNAERTKIFATEKRKKMNAKQINQTYSIIEFLSSKGFEPTKIRGQNYWYISMIRDFTENTPSFKVDKNLNRWYDHSLGKGGNLVDLACLVLKTENIKQVIQELLNLFSSFQQPQVRVEKVVQKGSISPKIKIVDIEEISNEPLIDYLANRGINKSAAQKYCQQIGYVNADKYYKSIGFKNQSDGYELRSEGFKSCVSPKDITFYDNGFEKLAVFEGFIDFLSYQMLVDFEIQNSDWLILNSLSFLSRVNEILSAHRQLFLFLDNDMAGKSAIKKIGEINSNYVDMTIMYADFKDLNDYLLWTKKNY